LIKSDDFDALALPGGFAQFNFYWDAYDGKFLDIIKQFHKQSKWIASICTGAMPIGMSGILNGEKTTTYNKNHGVHQETLHSFGVNVQNLPIVIDGKRITS